MLSKSSFDNEKQQIVAAKAQLDTFVKGMFDVANIQEFLNYFNIPPHNAGIIQLYIYQNPVYRTCQGFDIGFSIDNKNGNCTSAKYMNVFHYCFAVLFLYYIKGENHSANVVHAIILFAIVQKLQKEGKKFTLNTNRFIRYVQSDNFSL